jgi:hypothetical protein
VKCLITLLMNGVIASLGLAFFSDSSTKEAPILLAYASPCLSGTSALISGGN